MPTKETTVAEMVDEIESGMTIGLGGWGSRRKPMAFVRELLRRDLKNLTLVSYGGPDVGLLVNAGKVAKVICGFVTLDSVALDPLWRKARQDGAVELMEVDEGLLYLGLQAASWRVPFLPARAGLGSAVLSNTPELTTIENPYSSGPFAQSEDADTAGNAMILSPDPFFDELFLGAATRRFVTAEKIVDAGTLSSHGPIERATIHRLLTDRVAPARRGAHFTANAPDYERDEAFQRHYVASTKTPEDWAAFQARFLEGSETDYLTAVDAWESEQ